MFALVKLIAEELRLPENEILTIISGGHSSYKILDIPKKGGGKRQIFIPSGEIKMLQVWAVERIISKFPVSEICFSFKKGKSILDNAKIHRKSNFFIGWIYGIFSRV